MIIEVDSLDTLLDAMSDSEWQGAVAEPLQIIDLLDMLATAGASIDGVPAYEAYHSHVKALGSDGSGL